MIEIQQLLPYIKPLYQEVFNKMYVCYRVLDIQMPKSVSYVVMLVWCSCRHFR